MEKEQKKSPVEIVQKLLAIHSTRKEASERMIKNNASKDLQDGLQKAAEQSDRFIKALLNELSQFGDAVQSEVNREDEYHANWNRAIAKVDKMSRPELSDTFRKSEDSLLKIYSEVVDQYPDLPVTLNDLIISQVKELKQTF